MQDILGRDGLLADAAFGKGHILGDRAVEVMADHQHVQMLFQRVHRVGHRRIGGTRQDVRKPHDLQDIRRMTAARAFGVKGVDRAALDRGQRVLDKARLVQRVGMDHHLHVHRIGHRQAAVDGAGRGAPVLVQLQGTGPGTHLFLQPLGQAGIALACKGQVHRKGIRRLHHPHDVPRPRRAGGGQRAMRGPGAAAQHGGQAGMQRIVDLLGADEMDMRVHPPCGQDAPLARDDLGARADDDVHPWLSIRVARLADLQDAPVAQSDVGLPDARMIHDQRVGDDRIRRPARAADLALPHAVADHLAAAELHLFAVSGQVTLHLDDQIGIGQPDPVASGRPVHVGIAGAGNAGWHTKLLFSLQKIMSQSLRHLA